MDGILNRFGALKICLSEILQARRYALSKHDTFTRKVEEEFKKFGETQEREATANLEARQREGEQQQEALENRRKSRATRVRRASTNIRTKLERQITERKNAWVERKREAREQAVREHEARRAAFEAESAELAARVKAAEVAAHEHREAVFALARIHGVKLETKRPAPNPEKMIPDDLYALATLEKRVAEVGETVEKGRTTLKRIFPASAAYAIALAVAVGVWAWLFQFDYKNPLALAIVIGFIVICI